MTWNAGRLLESQPWLRTTVRRLPVKDRPQPDRDRTDSDPQESDAPPVTVLKRQAIPSPIDPGEPTKDEETDKPEDKKPAFWPMR